MNTKDKLTRLLKLTASAIDALNEEELEELLEGKWKLVAVSLKPKTLKPKSLSQEQPDYELILQRLNDCTSRDEAKAILAEVKNKDILTQIAKSQKLHVTKQDRREDIENKITEFFAGTRLRTNAIQTLNMKGGNDNT